MRVALVNPPWTYEGSIYFGCREPHLPLELGYTRALLQAGGHETLMLDGQIEGLASREAADRVAAFRPDMTVVTTAPVPHRRLRSRLRLDRSPRPTGLAPDPIARG